MTTLLRLQITVLVLIFSVQIGTSQDSWKKLSATGDRLFEEGTFGEAGDKYFSAWKLKPKKTELAFKAGDAYFLTRDYNKAIKAYKVVKDNNSDFHHVGFKYAKCLKSLEQYDEASREFVFFINNYGGDDFQDMSQLVQTEILGCEMGIKDADVSKEGVNVTHLSESINSGSMEYAPLPYSDDILYFSSDKSSTSKIYRTQNLEGEWSQSKSTDKIFHSVSREHYGNVSFAPDNSRFYFTQCDATKSASSKCDIYVVESKADGSWSDPIILPEYINDPESTNTHPCVVHANGKETIYFSSSRPGGKGGMDIWYSSRDLNSSSMDFTFPKNLGSRLNTFGDEITPFYDDESSTLYFSSDGHIGYGGFDIYQSQGSEFDWDKPQNLGKPLNSAQDDRYYIFASTPENGFFVSNRKSGLSKLTTTDEDIFYFGEDIAELAIKGKIMDDGNKSLEGVKITLYEVSSNGQKRIIASQMADNKFIFPLVENKAYVLEASKSAYTASVFEFEIPSGGSSMNQDVVLMGGSATAASSPSAPEIPGAKPNKPKPEIEKPTFVDTPIKSKPEVIEEPTFEEPIKPTSKPVKPSRPVGTVETVTEPIETLVETAPVPIKSTPVKPSTAVSSPSTPDHSVYKPVESRPVTSNPNVSTSSPSTVSSSSSTTYPSSTPSNSASKPSALDNSWYPNHGSSNTTNNSSTSSNVETSNTEYSASPSQQSGVYYKIQMEAMKTYKYNKYSSMADIGTVESEDIPDKNLVRILLGNYYNKEDAIAARNEVRSRGFDRAYVVKYRDGKRVSIKVFYND